MYLFPVKKTTIGPNSASRFLSFYLIFLLILKIVAISSFICFPGSIFFADIVKSALINLVNNEREELGIQSLKENPILSEAAYLKAQDMLEKDYFSHYSPEGVDPWYWFKESGYNYQFAGENLAIGFLESEQVFNGWIQSPSHRNNLLSSKYSETGIAVMKGEFDGKETTVVVQLFGKPQALSTAGEASKPIPIAEAQELEPKEEEIMKELPPEELVAGEEKESESEKGLTFQLSSFIFSEYFGLTQKIIYASLIFVIIALMINIFVKFNVQHKDLIYKAVFFLVLLVLFIVLDKSTIIQIISHSFNIY